MRPSSNTGISIVALSVSMSATTWPLVTSSPSFTFQRTMVPASMVSESRGMVTEMGIGSSFRLQAL